MNIFVYEYMNRFKNKPLIKAEKNSKGFLFKI